MENSVKDAVTARAWEMGAKGQFAHTAGNDTMLWRTLNSTFCFQKSRDVIKML